MNYAPGTGSAPTITALDASMAVLGSYDLSALAPISTPAATNGGAFRGIQSTSANIRYFTLSGSYILAHSLTVGGAATAGVPEPATWAMMMLGFGAMGASLRRRAKVTARVRFA
ncbi:MAG: PEP-CTERM sorting domain-containing protein [Proteobacteria bacterium]|nr:PEP-CTERM sorting domain-containing protein [Pseudomonadota bacterium]